MSDAWERLERAGVPCGAPSEQKPELSDLAAVAAATREVLADAERLSERQRVSLFAWLRAWSSSFPTSYRKAFGEDGAATLARASEGVTDSGRYLKLRRIAREKLLRVL